MPIIDGGSSTSNKVNVDANYNLNVNTPLVASEAGYTTVQSEVDSGAVVGSRTLRQPTTSVFNRLSVGLDTLQFYDYFNATAQNTALWKSAVNLFTFAFGLGGYINFNNALITTTGASAIYQSNRTFSLESSTPLMFEFSEFRAVIPATNQQFEAGLFTASLGTAPYTPTDGVYFRMTSSGLFGVLNYAGTEMSVELLTSSEIVLNDNTTYRIIADHYRVEFWGASTTSNPRILLGVIPVPSQNGPPFSSMNLPVAIRLYNNGTVSSGVTLKIANVAVTEMDTNQGKPASHQLNGMGLMPYQGQNGGTMGTSASYANSQAAGTGTVLSNTGTLATGFGGQAAILPTLTAGTDGIVCSFQNPQTSTTQTGRTLYITGVKVQGAVTTVLAGGPVIYFYSLAFGHTSVSMATTESVTTKAPRRIPLGIETYAATAAVGTLGSTNGVYLAFNSPVVVNAGEFVAIVVKTVGTVTTAGVITALVAFDAYYE
jgi:hypothetical protein